jgi:hypothetical protein
VPFSVAQTLQREQCPIMAFGRTLDLSPLAVIGRQLSAGFFFPVLWDFEQKATMLVTAGESHSRKTRLMCLREIG